MLELNVGCTFGLDSKVFLQYFQKFLFTCCEWSNSKLVGVPCFASFDLSSLLTYVNSVRSLLGFCFSCLSTFLNWFFEWSACFGISSPFPLLSCVP